MRNLVAALFTTFILFSCNEESSISEIDILDVNNPIIEHILDLGYALEDIQDMNEYFVVEGDISFSKKIETYNHLLDKTENQKHARSQGLINAFNRRIDIYLDINSFPVSSRSRVQMALNRAISIFNGLGTDIYMRQSNSSIDITIYNDSNITLCGLGESPVNGRPGRNVRLNDSAMNNPTRASENSWTGLILHEIGHNIGLRHTDWHVGVEEFPPAIHIPGTPLNDRQSIMNKTNGFCNGGNLSNFSTNDRLAIRLLYGDNYFFDCSGKLTVCGVWRRGGNPYNRETPEGKNVHVEWDHTAIPSENVRITLRQKRVGIHSEIPSTPNDGLFNQTGLVLPMVSQDTPGFYIEVQPSFASSGLTILSRFFTVTNETEER